MRHEAGAAFARANYVAKLPDPSVGGTVFMPPMNFNPDRQVAEFQVMQMVPWLGRLRAEARQAYFEAMAAENMFQAEKLRVIGDLRATWFKLYVLGKQIETALAEQSQLESLIKTANARIATGDAQPGTYSWRRWNRAVFKNNCSRIANNLQQPRQKSIA